MATAPANVLGVTVSSTFTDLPAHRAAVIKALQGEDLFPFAMENDSAKLADVIESSLQMVRKGAAYIGILTHKYGQVPDDFIRNPNHLSITELEFNEAQRLSRPILLFLMSDDHDVKPKDIELDPANRDKLTHFKDRAKNISADSKVHRVYYTFKSVEDFALAVTKSIADLRRHLEESHHHPRTTVESDEFIAKVEKSIAKAKDPITAHPARHKDRAFPYLWYAFWVSAVVAGSVWGKYMKPGNDVVEWLTDIHHSFICAVSGVVSPMIWAKLINSVSDQKRTVTKMILAKSGLCFVLTGIIAVALGFLAGHFVTTGKVLGQSPGHELTPNRDILFGVAALVTVIAVACAYLTCIKKEAGIGVAGLRVKRLRFHFLVTGLTALIVSFLVASALSTPFDPNKPAVVFNEGLPHLLKVALVDHHLNIPEALAAILKYPLLLLPLASLGAILVGWIIADSGENGKHDINDVKIFAERIGDVASEVLKCVLWAAPLAVGAAAAEFFARDDSADATIVSLFTLLFTASALFVLIELVLARLPLEFFGATRRSVRRGFTTTSSELALNDAFQDMDEEGVPRNISDFVLTTGTNFNLGGSALYVALAVAFVQKAVSNPTPLEYLQTLVLLLGTTRLVAPIPRASITVIITTLGFGGLLQPKADYYLGVIFGMDFVCDALRTAVNVFSNCVCAKWVAVSEDSGLRTNSRENKSESST